MARGEIWMATLIAMRFAGTALAQSTGDGFTGWEKKVTSVTGQGEPEISIGPAGNRTGDDLSSVARVPLTAYSTHP